MKKYVFCVLYLFLFKFSMAQEDRKKFDFIISVDEEIVKKISKSLIIVKQGESVLKKINVSYYPGNLSIASEDYDMIFSDQGTSLFIQFDYYQYSFNGEQEIYNYEIEIGRNLLQPQSFVILKIYNLDKKKYRKRFDPLSKDKNYTFELDGSEGQMLRIKKR